MPLIAAFAFAGEGTPPPIPAVESLKNESPNAAGAAGTVKPDAPDPGQPGSQAKDKPPATHKEFTDAPVPFVSTTPNEGTSYGFLTAIMKYNKENQVSTLLAPQYNYNKNFGLTMTLYGAYYPKLNQQVEVNLSQSTIINRDFDVRFRDKTFMDAKLETNGYAGDILPTARPGSSAFSRQATAGTSQIMQIRKQVLISHSATRSLKTFR